MAGALALALALLLSASAQAARKPAAKATATIVGCDDDRVILAISVKGTSKVRRSELRLAYSVTGLFGEPRRAKEVKLGTKRSATASKDFTGLPADVYTGIIRYRFVRGRRTIFRGSVRTTSAKVGRRRGRGFCTLPIGRRPEDRTPPVVAVAPASDAATWQRGPLQGSFVAADDLSGVAAVNYSIDGGPAQTGRSFTIASEGAHTVVYAARDVAGNVSAAQQATYRVDASAPSAPVVTGPASGSVTGNTTPTVSWTAATDGASGVQSYAIVLTGSGGQVAFSRSVPASSLAVTVGTALPDDVYTVQVTAVDGASQPFSTASAPVQFTVDRNIEFGGCSSFTLTGPFACSDGPLVLTSTDTAGTNNATLTSFVNVGPSPNGFTLQYDVSFTDGGSTGRVRAAVDNAGLANVKSYTTAFTGSDSVQIPAANTNVRFEFQHALGGANATYQISNVVLLRNP